MNGRFTELLANVGLGLDSLGNAYLVLLGSIVLTLALFASIRIYLVVTPNRQARDYGLYIVTVLVALIIAATLENQIAPREISTIGYALFPQLILLAAIHYWIYQDPQPWLITLGASAIAGSTLTAVPAALLQQDIRSVHWLAVALLVALLAFLVVCSISTKRGFLRARSIYVESKERTSTAARPQRPWLGLPQWVFLAVASLALAMVNATLAGSGIGDVPALSVLIQSLVLLAITVSVSAVPAGTYWLAHRHWMPELTRFVWLVWLVVGFAFCYGNFLSSLQ